MFFWSILFSYSRTAQLPCYVEELPINEACVSFRLVKLVLLFVAIHNKVTFAITQFAIQFFLAILRVLVKEPFKVLR